MSNLRNKHMKAEKITTVLICTNSVSLVVGLLSLSLIFSKDNQPFSSKIATVNIKELVQLVSHEITTKNLNEKNLKEAIDRATQQLNQEIHNLAKEHNQVIFQTGAVLGLVPDQTDELKNRIRKVLK